MRCYCRFRLKTHIFMTRFLRCGITGYMLLFIHHVPTFHLHFLYPLLPYQCYFELAISSQIIPIIIKANSAVASVVYLRFFLHTASTQPCHTALTICKKEMNHFVSAMIMNSSFYFK